jgi:hypothetical protein
MAATAAATNEKSPTPLATSIDAWLLQQTATEILREVVARCDAAEIPVLPVKGVVTSRLLYDDIAERPMTDVDIRIRPRDFERFRRVAAAAGWRCLRVARSYGNLIYDFGPLSLDVEAYVGPPGLCSLPVDVMLARSERTEILAGQWISLPELHDHAVLLMVNAFKDKLVTAPAWAIGDLERIVLQPRFQRDVFVDRVGQSQVITIAWIVAKWMKSVHKSDGWRAIGTALESQPGMRWTYARLFQRQLPLADRGPMSLRLLARIGADSRRMQLEALARAVAWSAEMWLRRSGGMSR